jgi:hypothetical protein
MAQRPRSRVFPNTLTGLLAAVALAVLAAFGIKTDWFHGKPSAPPIEQTPVSTTTPPAPAPASAPAPGTLPQTPRSFEAAKKILYAQVYNDHRVTFYCGCTYSADRKVDLARCGWKPWRTNPAPSGSKLNTFSPLPSSATSGPAGVTAFVSGLSQRGWLRAFRSGLLPAGRSGVQ